VILVLITGREGTMGKAAVGFVLLVLSLPACSDAGGEEKALVMTTTSVLGDVVERVVGDDATVEVLMPRGTDPHDFEPSLRQATRLSQADVVVTSGRGFEAGLGDLIEATRADGVPVHEASSVLGGFADPHWFTDPLAMAQAATGIAAALDEDVVSLDGGRLTARAEEYGGELRDLTSEMASRLSRVPAGRRTLVTDHEVFAAFARRFDYEVVGALVPRDTTLAEPSPAALAELAETVKTAGVPAIFVEVGASDRLARAVADEVEDGVKVVELYTETLGPEGSDGATYVDAMRTDAERIAQALG
jgi:zinc/manganese transport system substrate-binding protein